MISENPATNRAHELKLTQTKILKVCIANLKVQISCIYGHSFRNFKNYLSAFEKPDINIEITNADIEEERILHPEIKVPEIHIDNENVGVTYDYGCLEPIIALKQCADLIIAYNTLLMHGSIVALDNQAYMFTAPSGVGKTTRTKLFCNHYRDAIVVNGDKPFIKITDTKVIACGTPWCGKEGWNTNTMIPLRAIFLLERAEEGEKSSIEEVSLGKAFPFLLQQTHRPQDPVLMLKTLELLKLLEGKVKIYRFHSAPTEDSVRLAYETAK